MYKERVPNPKIASNGAKNRWYYADFFYLWMGFKGYGNNEDDNGKWKYNLD